MYIVVLHTSCLCTFWTVSIVWMRRHQNSVLLMVFPKNMLSIWCRPWGLVYKINNKQSYIYCYQNFTTLFWCLLIQTILTVQKVHKQLVWRTTMYMQCMPYPTSAASYLKCFYFSAAYVLMCFNFIYVLLCFVLCFYI
jgi:hypothetical protein